MAFPFKAQKLMQSARFRRISHITEVLLVIAFASVPSIIVLSTSGYSYAGFPPTCNVSDPDLLFYTFTLPYALISTYGLCALLATLWILRKVYFTIKLTFTTYTA